MLVQQMEYRLKTTKSLLALPHKNCVPTQSSRQLPINNGPKNTVTATGPLC